MTEKKNKNIPNWFCPKCKVILCKTSRRVNITEIKFNIFDFYRWVKYAKNCYEKGETDHILEQIEYHRRETKLIESIVPYIVGLDTYPLDADNHYSNNADMLKNSLLSHFIKNLYHQRYIDNIQIYSFMPTETWRRLHRPVKIIIEPEKDFYIAFSPTYKWLESLDGVFRAELLDNGIKDVSSLSNLEFFTLLEQACLKLIPGISDSVRRDINEVLHDTESEASPEQLKNISSRKGTFETSQKRFEKIIEVKMKDKSTFEICLNCGTVLPDSSSFIQRLPINIEQFFKAVLASNKNKISEKHAKLGRNFLKRALVPYLTRGYDGEQLPLFKSQVINIHNFTKSYREILREIMLEIVYMYPKLRPFRAKKSFSSRLVKFDDTYISIFYRHELLAAFIQAYYFLVKEGKPETLCNLTYHDLWVTMQQMIISKASAAN
jgi:uncharacterized protein with PIN domain